MLRLLCVPHRGSWGLSGCYSALKVLACSESVLGVSPCSDFAEGLPAQLCGRSCLLSRPFDSEDSRPCGHCCCKPALENRLAFRGRQLLIFLHVFGAAATTGSISSSSPCFLYFCCCTCCCSVLSRATCCSALTGAQWMLNHSSLAPGPTNLRG